MVDEVGRVRAFESLGLAHAGFHSSSGQRGILWKP